MRATEEAAFWLYSAKDGMNAFVPDRLKAHALSMAYVVHPEGVNTIIPVVTKWYHVLYGEFCGAAAEQLRKKLPPALHSYSDEEIVDNYKNLLE